MLHWFLRESVRIYVRVMNSFLDKLKPFHRLSVHECTVYIFLLNWHGTWYMVKEIIYFNVLGTCNHHKGYFIRLIYWMIVVVLTLDLTLLVISLWSVCIAVGSPNARRKPMTSKRKTWKFQSIKQGMDHTCYVQCTKLLMILTINYLDRSTS